MSQPTKRQPEKVAKYLEHCDYCRRWAVVKGTDAYSGQYLCAVHYNAARRAGNEA